MTAVCGACGAVFWAKDGHSCSKRRASCARLPRRCATVADIEALDRGLIEAGLASSAAAARADEIGRALASAFEAAGLPVPAGCLPSLRLIQGGAA